MTTVRHILEIKGYDVWKTTPDTTVYDALRLMADKDVGALLVMDNDQLVGIVSERDYARKIILHGRSSRDTLVSDMMTRVVYTIHPAQTVQECMELMIDKRIRHLPVIEEGRVMGVISIGDVLKDIIYQQKVSIKSLESQLLGKKW
jgi:CBS domain-containing protein